MGVYDRDYYRSDEPRGIQLSAPQSISARLALLNVVVFVVDLFTSPAGDLNSLAAALSLRSESLVQPLEYWRFLTYGFAHDSGNVMHLLFNMIALIAFGPAIEERQGRMEFLRFYLLAILVSGLGWAALETARGEYGVVVGASGGTTATVLLYCVYYPHRQVLAFGVLPMPAWMLGGMLVLLDALGATGRGGSQIAFVAHLSGAAFAGVYGGLRLNFTRVLPSFLSLDRLWRLRQPRLRVHDPEAEEKAFAEQVDAVLEKLGRDGEASLTKKERKLLEEASRRYQQRRR